MRTRQWWCSTFGIFRDKGWITSYTRAVAKGLLIVVAIVVGVVLGNNASSVLKKAKAA